MLLRVQVDKVLVGKQKPQDLRRRRLRFEARLWDVECGSHTLLCRHLSLICLSERRPPLPSKRVPKGIFYMTLLGENGRGPESPQLRTCFIPHCPLSLRLSGSCRSLMECRFFAFCLMESKPSRERNSVKDS